jgi:hypothetical protein
MNQIGGDVPKWARALMLLIGRFPESTENHHVSAVISPPKAPYFAAAAALVGIEKSLVAQPTEIGHGQKIATIVGNQFRDSIFYTNPFRISGNAFAEGKAPPIRELPPGFPERSDRTISENSAALLVNLDGSVSALLPNWSLFEYSANPVLVLCNQPSLLAQKLREQTEDFDFWNPIQRVSAVEPGLAITDWFRSPIILASPSGLLDKEWVFSLEPRLVVNVGMSTWEKRLRWIWPMRPHILVLDAVSADVSNFRNWYEGRDVGYSSDTISSFGGVPGLPMRIFGEEPGIFDFGQEDLEFVDEFS